MLCILGDIGYWSHSQFISLEEHSIYAGYREKGDFFKFEPLRFVDDRRIDIHIFNLREPRARRRLSIGHRHKTAFDAAGAHFPK